VPDLTEPLQYHFFVRGLIAATLAGGLCGLLGVYIVLRRMSYIGHGLSHAIFGGAVVSYVISVNFYIGAGLWGFVSALLINLTSRRRTIGADAAIGIITTASFALGIALISRYNNFTRSFDAALFGSILGVSDRDLWILAIVTALTVGFVFFAYKQLLFNTFDPEVAPFYGVRSTTMDTLFALVLASAIIASMRILGVTLIAAAIVIPPICARLVTDSFSRMLVFSALLGAANGFAGMYLSYFLDSSSGATIVLLGAAGFCVALAYASLRESLGRLGGVRAPAPAPSSSAPAFEEEMRTAGPTR
jgi:manganese/iron transport system permease protein/iron/zinc/copper transport system permease protein